MNAIALCFIEEEDVDDLVYSTTVLL